MLLEAETVESEEIVDSEVAMIPNVHGTLAEWLRRQIRNLLGIARVSSNLTDVVFLFYTHKPQNFL